MLEHWKMKGGKITQTDLGNKKHRERKMAEYHKPKHDNKPQVRS